MKIAIDGPAGAGKSTVARRLAEELGFVYIDTGAMYRVLTWKALQRGLDLYHEEELNRLASSIKIHFENDCKQQKVLCDGKDLTAAIRLPEVNAAVSTVASHPTIRRTMVEQQQHMASSISVVMDGRDIGECVLPDAEYKFFVTASVEERARRRAAELAASGLHIDYNTILQEITRRDKNDSERQTGALKILPDSIIIDSSEMSVEQVLQKMLAIIQGE
ncbi:(d)CMP kinase [Syntrophomonas curvata]